MTLENIVQQLHEQKSRLQKELTAVVNMIKASGRGAQAAMKEYGNRVSGNGQRKSRKKAAASNIAPKRRKMSSAARKRIAAAQKARWARVKASKKSSKATIKPTSGVPAPFKKAKP